MTRAELLAALAAATGPDRVLDGKIMFHLHAKPAGTRGYIWPEDDPSWSFALAFGNPVPEAVKARAIRDRQPGDDPKEWIEFEHEGRWILMNALRVPRLTASLDAALTLVPEGFAWQISKLLHGGVSAVIQKRGPNGEGFSHWIDIDKAATPTLALCIAALSARAP